MVLFFSLALGNFNNFLIGGEEFVIALALGTGYFTAVVLLSQGLNFIIFLKSFYIFGLVFFLSSFSLIIFYCLKGLLRLLKWHDRMLWKFYSIISIFCLAFFSFKFKRFFYKDYFFGVVYKAFNHLTLSSFHSFFFTLTQRAAAFWKKYTWSKGSTQRRHFR